MGHDSNGFTDAMMPWSTYHVAPLGHDAQDAMMGSILDHGMPKWKKKCGYEYFIPIQ